MGLGVESEVGKGTTFHVYLPLADQEATEELDKQEHHPRGTERIIFVDDEKALVRSYSLALGSLGYDVIPCTSSREALDIFQKEPEQVDLIITDMTMPGMTGEVLTKEVQKIRPDTPIIICTGHSERIAEETVASLGIAGYAIKPIVKRDIAVTIRKVLDGGD